MGATPNSLPPLNQGRVKPKAATEAVTKTESKAKPSSNSNSKMNPNALWNTKVPTTHEQVISLSELAEKSQIPHSTFSPVDSRPFFDIPVTYNSKVKTWIKYFQGRGSKWFGRWLERSARYLPMMQTVLKERGLPQDLAYIAMIESGFSAHATSHAAAVGYWQFIGTTADRYGLQVNWWIDERRDFSKSTHAASRYLGDLYKMFGSWYLTAAAYNMGEGRLSRLIKKHNSTNFWVLSKKPDFPSETRDYIPKLISAMLIAKAPKLYGFHDLKPLEPHNYEYFIVPGGTDLHNLAKFLETDQEALMLLNPELLKGIIPSTVKQHRIRIPNGWNAQVAKYIRATL